jgi:hypothetical protein
MDSGLDVLCIFTDATYQTKHLVKPAAPEPIGLVERVIKPKAPSPYWDERPEFVFCKGSAWATKIKGETYLITAAHVLLLNETLAEDAPEVPLPERRKILSVRQRVYVGALAYEPAMVGLIGLAGPAANNAPADIAILRFSESAGTKVFSSADCYDLAAAQPNRGDKVTAIGYGEKDFPDHKAAAIIYVAPNLEFFIIDLELGPGFSGGVVINQSNQALGVIKGTTKGQTTIARLTSSQLAAANFFPYNELIAPHPVTAAASPR